MDTMPASDSQFSTNVAQLALAMALDALPSYLSGQRWFADKHRTIEALDLLDHATIPAGPGLVILAIFRVSFSGGSWGEYFIPLTVDWQPLPDSRSICSSPESGRPLHVSDAASDSRFQRWLLYATRSELEVSTGNGSVRFASLAEDADQLAPAPARLAAFEQSNSSILYGDELIAKVYRRLSPGTNPDVEIGTFLARHTTFRESPALLGFMQHHMRGTVRTLAMIQEQLHAPVNLWSRTLEALSHRNWQQAGIGDELGALTARLHLALAADFAEPAFQPVPAGESTVSLWKTGLIDSVAQVSALLSERFDRLDDRNQELAVAFRTVAGGLRDRAAGFDALRDLPLIRVHGDYHLGQVLRTAEGALSIVDFEGEPQRPIDERRLRTSPLKDVAGMLRSFSYARGAALEQLGGTFQADLIGWERHQRDAFLSAYQRVIREGNPALIPADQEALDAALAAWEIDKALYEIMYELSSRPDWLWLPLSSVVKYG